MAPRVPKPRHPNSDGSSAGETSGSLPTVVGYGKPPVGTRFRPGTSGNPKGRPRGARNKLPELNEERLKNIILTEAYRTIKVNDGRRQVSIPMAQAIVRSVAVNAVKGQHRSQRLFSELLSATEAADKALHDEWLESALDYKQSWQDEIQRCRRLGLPPPDPVPHPDHIELDIRTGKIVVDGPMDHKQREAGHTLITRYISSSDELEWIRKERKRTRSTALRAIFDADIGHLTRLIQKIAACIDRLPWLKREWQEACKKQDEN